MPFDIFSFLYFVVVLLSKQKLENNNTSIYFALVQSVTKQCKNQKHFKVLKNHCDHFDISDAEIFMLDLKTGSMSSPNTTLNHFPCFEFF